MSYFLTDEQWAALDESLSSKLEKFESDNDGEFGEGHYFEDFPDINANNIPDFLENGGSSSSGSNVVYEPSHNTSGV